MPDSDPKKPRRTVTWSDLLGMGDGDPLDAVKEWAPNVVIPVLGLGALHLYTTYLRRIPGSAHIRPSFFRRRTLFGRVTSVGDGDNFHMFHTPGGLWAGWGWLRRVPTMRAGLKNRTIPIRLAGVDAPEGAHFGRPAQPYAAEALAWLARYILHRPVRARIWKRDQYERVVATVHVRRWLVLRRDVGLEMVRAGWALTYEAKTGAEFGGLEVKYRAAEARARTERRGMWAGKPSAFESPGAYKARWKAAEKGG